MKDIPATQLPWSLHFPIAKSLSLTTSLNSRNCIRDSHLLPTSKSINEMKIPRKIYSRRITWNVDHIEHRSSFFFHEPCSRQQKVPAQRKWGRTLCRDKLGLTPIFRYYARICAGFGGPCLCIFRLFHSCSSLASINISPSRIRIAIGELFSNACHWCAVDLCMRVVRLRRGAFANSLPVINSLKHTRWKYEDWR